MNANQQRWVLASNNAGKLRELSALLSPLELTLVNQGDLGVSEAAETASSFVENALIKARHAARATGLPALADDSGLAVDLLHGAPGVYSARYAGANASDADNIGKLLAALQGQPEAQRSARFICVIVLLRHAEDPLPLICQGVWEGRILQAPQGSGGFGYDPVFFSPEYQCAAAQLTAEQKRAVSHRGKALTQLLQLLSQQGEHA